MTTSLGIIDTLAKIEEFKEDRISSPDIDLVFIQGCPKNSAAAELVREYHEKRFLAHNKYVTTYVDTEAPFLAKIISDYTARLKDIDDRLKSTPEFLEMVDQHTKIVGKLGYRSDDQRLSADFGGLASRQSASGANAADYALIDR